jgi:alpha-galactosidase
MKRIIRKLMIISALLISGRCLMAQQTITVTTTNTQMIFGVNKDKKLMIHYYGEKLSDDQSIFDAGINLNRDAVPCYGIKSTTGVVSMRVTHADGNLSLDLEYVSHSVNALDDNSLLTEIRLKDKIYPFYVTLKLTSFLQQDVIEMSSEFYHEETKPVMLYEYASAYIPVLAHEYWLTHFHGTWAHEFIMNEEQLTYGTKVIDNYSGSRNTQTDNPSFFLTLNDKPSETKGHVIAGSLAYTGSYKIEFKQTADNTMNMTAGMSSLSPEYKLERGEKFSTPELILTFSNQGKGLASRNLHRYARAHKLLGGKKERKILLNSWEGVYFKFVEDDIVQMIDDMASIGGELFVLDDGWFGNKYERNGGNQGLGDWEVSQRKLSRGIDYLIDEAEKRGIKFGIWVEPEMVNTKSELYEKHPDWITQVKGREIVKGRGGTQVVLDLSNPEVQDFVFEMLSDLLTKHPRLDYIKWDANADIVNNGSNYLSADKQAHLDMEYQRGLRTVLEKLRAKYPDIVIQVCSSGGGRVNYGYLPYFHEFWPSDNTDALKRLYIQWGTSHVFPAIAMASHVSATKNHQTGREIPLKFRFDVAMTGRLGLELQPRDMTDNERAFSKEAIHTYKRIRPIVQFGDQYRLVSPYDNKHVASLMYVDNKQLNAVLFAFHLTLDNEKKANFPPFKMQGLDPEKQYRVTEINKDKHTRDKNGRLAVKDRFKGSGCVFTGKFLMEVGVYLNFRREYESAVLEVSVVD